MFVILGATGKAGRTTIKKLRGQGAPVRGVVRKSSNTDDLRALGCEIALADLSDVDALKSAISGAEAVQVICPVQPRAEDAAERRGRCIGRTSSSVSHLPRPPGRLAYHQGALELLVYPGSRTAL
jgi:NAD(P)H dehydrogenase (quinone)